MRDSLNILCPWCGGVDSNDCIYYHTNFNTRCTICGKSFDVVTRRNSKNDKWETYKCMGLGKHKNSHGGI